MSRSGSRGGQGLPWPKNNNNNNLFTEELINSENTIEILKAILSIKYHTPQRISGVATQHTFQLYPEVYTIPLLANPALVHTFNLTLSVNSCLI